MASNNELRLLCKDLLEKLNQYNTADPYHNCSNLIDRALYALGENLNNYHLPKTVDARVLRLGELKAYWNLQADQYNSWDTLSTEEMVTFAQQLALARPAIRPVLAIHYPWEMHEGWCDGDGQLWWCPPQFNGKLPVWKLIHFDSVRDGWVLPYYAIPAPVPYHRQPKLHSPEDRNNDGF
jgi:hypothetical protein